MEEKKGKIRFIRVRGKVVPIRDKGTPRTDRTQSKKGSEIVPKYETKIIKNKRRAANFAAGAAGGAVFGGMAGKLAGVALKRSKFGRWGALIGALGFGASAAGDKILSIRKEDDFTRAQDAMFASTDTSTAQIREFHNISEGSERKAVSYADRLLKRKKR
jgi:hypothetical protein